MTEPEFIEPDHLLTEIYHGYRAGLIEEEIDTEKHMIEALTGRLAEARSLGSEASLNLRIERRERTVAMLRGWLAEERDNEARAKRRREDSYEKEQ